MMRLTYQPDDPSVPVRSGMVIEVPHVWSSSPPHQVTVESVWPDRPDRYIAFGWANGYAVMVTIPVPYPGAG